VSFYSELIIIIIKVIKCNFYFGNVLSCSVVSFAFRTSTLVLELHSLALWCLNPWLGIFCLGGGCRFPCGPFDLQVTLKEVFESFAVTFDDWTGQPLSGLIQLIQWFNFVNCPNTYFRYKVEQICRGTEECGGSWFTTAWSECTETCGGGTNTRKVLFYWWRVLLWNLFFRSLTLSGISSIKVCNFWER
jgi:hypothetical protein